MSDFGQYDNYYMPIESDQSYENANSDRILDSESATLEVTIETEIEIFPNPFTNGFSIRNVPSDSYISVLSIDGKEVFSTFVTSETERYVDLFNLSLGTYIVKITSESGSYRKKITKH